MMNMIFIKDGCVDIVTYDSWCTARVDIDKLSVDVDVDVDMIWNAEADPH